MESQLDSLGSNFFQFYLPLLPPSHPLLPIGFVCPLNNYFLAFPTRCHLKVVFAPEISSSAKSLLKGRRGTENRLLDFIEKSRK